MEGTVLKMKEKHIKKLQTKLAEKLKVLLTCLDLKYVIISWLG